MADWTTIADATLEPGKPWRSVDALAVRDNPIAISEGAAGAPRVRTAALQSPAAGTASIIFRLQEAEAGSTSITYGDTGFHNRSNSSTHLGVSVLVSGVVTCYVQHKTDNGGFVSAYVRVLKNGVLVQEWGTSSTTYTTRQVDVTVSTGDALIFQQRAETGVTSTWRNLRIYSANPDMAVC